MFLCVPLIFSCSNNKKDNSKSSERMNTSLDRLTEQFSKECIKGNEGKPDWEAYCHCAAKQFIKQFKETDMIDIANMTEEDGMAMGLDAGLDCMHLLSDDLSSIDQTDKMDELMHEALYNSCLSGNEGNPNWERYCNCAAENMMETIPTLEEWDNLSDDDAMEIGMQAGMECLDYLN